MSLIGHNHPPFETIADLPEDLPKMHFFKNDIQAFRKAIVDKPLDVRGAFFSAILAMYEYMEPIPADDHMAMLRVGIHNTKLWRRVKAELISHGLVQVTPGGRLTNHRFEAEITSYVVEFKNRREAALERERKAKVARATKGDKPATNPLATELQPRSNPVANEFQGGNNSFETAQKPSFDVKKDNNFNGDHTTRRPQPAPQDDHESRIRARVLELEREKEKKEKKEYSPPDRPPEYPAGGHPPRGGVPGLNEATSVVVEQLAQWLSPFAPDVTTAMRMVGEWVKQYGPEAVRDGYADYKAEISERRMRVPTAKGLLSFIKQSELNLRRRAPPPRGRGGNSGTYRPSREDLAEAVEAIENASNPSIIDVSFKQVN